MIINGYKLISDWKKREFFLEAKAEQDEKLYYIKKFPKDMINDNGKLFFENDFAYEDFCERRVRLLTALKDCREYLILPLTAFIFKDEYYEVIEKKQDLSGYDALYNSSYENIILVIKSVAKHLMLMHSKRIILTPNKKSFLTRMLPSNEIETFIAGIEYADFELNYSGISDVKRLENYISPEIAALKNTSSARIFEKKVTCKSDVFILGLIVHDCLTGGKIPKIVNKDLKYEDKKSFESPAEALNCGLNLVISDKIGEPYLRHLIANMLNPDPAKRPSMDTVFDALSTKRVLQINNDRVLVNEKTESVFDAEFEKNATVKKENDFESFCAPWEDHDIKFNHEALRVGKYVKVERFIHYDVKCYKLFRDVKSLPKVMTVETLIKLDLASKKSTDTYNTESKSDKFPDVWEEHSSYKPDMTEIYEARYVAVKPEIRENKKGYALITKDGRTRFFTFDIMVYMGYLKLK